MTSPSPAELKPCPFCGGPAVSYRDSDGDWEVFCNGDGPSCIAEITSRFPTEAGAIAAWNRRSGEREAAWLIESKDATGRPRWWGDWNEDHLCDWTYDSLKAIRFVHKEDAERAIAMAEWIDVMREDCSATEHAWFDPRRALASPSEKTKP